MRLLSVFCFVVLLQSCASQVKKINGVSFVASGDSISNKSVRPIVNINANYAALMPFAYLKAIDSSQVYYNMDRQWFGETRAGLKQYSKWMRKNHINIMVKPQLWVRNGEFTGTIMMSSENDWQQLQDTYRAFILDYAKVAEELQAELFCIGTELELFVKHRPDYWLKLIRELREVYNGQLTYAANWDEYKRIPFWEELDFIGVDAYFPVSEEKTPSIEQASLGWQKHKLQLKTMSESKGRPILFTEYGYRSIDYAGRKPWETSRNITGVNMQAQVNLTEALYKSLWREPWFYGGFIWKWFHNHEKVGGLNNNRFTPQNKPVEAIIESYYGEK